jgi:hypothetical protein
MEESCRLHAPAVLIQEKALDNHWIGGWLDTTAGLDGVKSKATPVTGLGGL